MKIKHLLLLFVIPLGLFSCSKDDTTPQENIIGTWEYVKDTYQYYDAKGVELVDKKEEDDYSGYSKKPYVEFKQGGIAVFADFDGEDAEVELETLKYTVKGNIITLTWQNDEGSETNDATFTINGGVLTMVSEYIYKETKMKEVTTSVLKRIK